MNFYVELNIWHDIAGSTNGFDYELLRGIKHWHDIAGSTDGLNSELLRGIYNLMDMSW